MNPNTGKNRILRLLFWESTIKCNLTCAHCRRVETDEAAPSDMATDQAMDMIDQLAAVGKEQGFMPVLVFSGGEPLCRDDIFDLIRHARKRELQLALASNGTLIDAAIAEKINNSGIQRVSISLDGATSEIHNKLRQLEGSFEGAIKGIGHLKKAGVPFQINVTITRFNAGQLDDVFALAEKLGAVAVHLFMLVPVGCGEEFATEDMLSADEYEKMMVRIAKLEVSQNLQIKVTCGPHYERVVRQAGLRKAPQKPDMPVCPHDHGKGGHPVGKPVHSSKGCLAGVSVIFVGHQGDVFPCGYLPVNCGNVLETRLKEIWNNSDDLAKMRDTNQLTGKCGVCEYRKICGGCRARAFSVKGDYMAEEPFCDYLPDAKK
ncbi:MAG: radical SAM protein [Planctomycetes bacterium]|nr:radical SAM protein [Planctomycetota bacterium]